MPDTQASLGYGTTFEMAEIATPTAMTYISEIFDFSPPSETTDQEDATHMQSPNKTREFIDGLTDPGEASLEMNYVPGSASDKYLTAAKGKRKWCRITYPNGVQVLFRGSRQAYEKSVPLDGKKTATVSFKVSGDPIVTDPTSPRNIVAPVIVGTAKVGDPLTLDPGIWAGFTDMDFQWKADGTNISGATGSSFVPLTANVGDLITCELTASNDAFDTVLATAATAAVVA